jgi:transglutaminase-like putative cysteine protease
LGSTLEDSQKVLAVRFRRHRDSQPYLVYGDLFLRGAVLNQYRDGRWGYRSSGDPIQIPVVEVERRDAPADLIRQEFRLEPLDRPELFCIWPSIYVARDDRVQFDPYSQRFQRTGGLLRRSFAYELATAAFANGRQTDLVPALAQVDLQPLLQWPAESLPNLAAQARQWLDQANVPADDPVGRGRALERALRTSPRFSYRLGETSRDQTLDPIEDFVVNDPRGHCEYFASALTLMLRSQGLPARLVVGYKSDEFNYLEERYWVRQSHAHAWVEAYIPPESIPDSVRNLHPSFDWSHGGWLRLDPTPSSLSELSLVEYLKQKLRDWQAATRTAWTQHVLQMSGTQQSSLIYRPMIQTLRETVSQLSRAAWFGDETGGSEYPATPRELLARVVPWIVVGMIAFALLAWRTLRHRSSRAGRSNRRRSRHPRRSSPGRFAASVEFYRRWEALFQRRGLRRIPSQTPREFAREAGARLAEATGQPQLRDAALCVSNAFYEVRFGGATLDDQQTAAVEDALHRIQQATR